MKYEQIDAMSNGDLQRNVAVATRIELDYVNDIQESWKLVRAMIVDGQWIMLLAPRFDEGRWEVSLTFDSEDDTPVFGPTVQIAICRAFLYNELWKAYKEEHKA